MSFLSKIERDLRLYYNEKAKTPYSSTQMGWKNDWAQIVRFIQLLKIIESEEPFSINDLGCGNGSLLTFMKTHVENKVFRYKGYDILPEMIASAESLNPADSKNFAVIQNVNQLDQADYTVSSGIFNLKYTASDDEWLMFIKETISVMWTKSEKGVAFNCLTSYSDTEFMRSELYYTDPLVIFDYCRKNFTKNIAILHDYREFDFTILLRK